MKHTGKRLFSLLLAVALLLGMFPTALIPLTSAALPAGDETIVSTLRVESIVDGSAPFDGDDKPGNDSNEHNKIVRSFDSVTYDFDVEVASVDPEDSFTEAYVRMEFILPVSKDQAEFDTAAMAWMESTGSHAFQVTDNGSFQTLVAYKHLTDDGKVVVPGSFGHNLTIQVKGMSNGSTIQPTIKASMEGNTASAEKSLTPAGVTVSAAPRFNIKIDGNSDYKDDFDFTTDGPNKDISSTKLPGRMMNLGVSVELYNNARDKAFKGVELPTGDIQFKLKLSSSFLINKSTNDAHSAGETIDAAAAGYTPLLWSIDGNEINDYGAPNGDGRVLYNTHGAVVNAAPYNHGGGENACYDGGSWSAQQLTDENGNPTGELLVTVSGYQIDINQMPIVNGDHSSNLNDYGKDKGIGVFSAGEIWVVQPFNYLNSETQPDGNSENYDIVRDYGEGAFTTSAEVTELNVTTVGGTLCDTQQEVTDDIYKCGLELVLPGSLQNRVYYAALENTSIQGVNVGTQRFGDDTATPGTEFYLRSGFTYLAEGEEANRIHWGTNLLRFPADVFELMGEIKDDYLFGAQGMTRTTYYAAKPDGKDWKDYEEMKTTTEDGLEFYTSLEELEGAGKKCVGILHFFSGTGPLNGMEPYYGALVRAKVAENAKPNTTVSIISTSRVWTQSMWIAGGSLEDPDLTKGKIEISNQYTDPKGETKYLNSGNYPGGTYYVPASYDENNVLTPHNSDWGHWGDTMLIIGYKSTLTLSEAQKVNGQEKETYTLDRSQREVDFVIQPAVNFDKNSSDGSVEKKTDLKITATLPKYLSFVEASSYWGGTYTQSSANGGVQGSVSNGTALAPVVTHNDLTGETTLTWELHDVVVGEAVSPIYFTAYIGSKSPDSDCPQGTTPLTVQATICGTEDNRAYIASNGNLASQGITVTKGRANSFTKYVKADTVEADGNVDYVIYSSNNATTEEAVYLMDTMPWDGQNGSSFSGSYHVSAWKLDTELCDASKLTVYYTLDSQYNGASTTSVSKDTVTSTWTKATIGSDGTLTDMNNQRPTAWAIAGTLDAAKAINIDLQIKLEPDYTNFRSQALYVNTISSGTLRSTASASVVQRSLSGYAWSDDDGDGTKLDVVNTASDRCAGTTFYSQGTKGDAILYLQALKEKGLQTADLKELKVVMSGSPNSNDPIKLYFRTDGKQWAEGSRFEINNPGLTWGVGEKLSEAEKEYVFDLSSSTNTNWRGELTEMRLDPLQGTGLYFNIKSITLVKADGSEILMDFCTKGAYKNYVRLSDDVNPNPSYPSAEDITLPQEALLSGKAAGSCFTVSDDTTKGDLYFELKDTMTYGLSTQDIRAIRFTASAQAPEGQEFAPARLITLYYATGSKTAYSENADQVLYLEEYIRQEEATYTFDLSNKSGWSGKINAIRIDPLEGVNYKVTLKSIMLDLADGTTRTFDFTVPGAWETYLKVYHSTGAPELVDTADGVVRDSVKVSLYRRGTNGGTTFSTGSNPDAILGFNDVMFRGLKTQDVSAVRVVMSGDSESINPPQLFYKSSNPNAKDYSGSRKISLGNTRLKKDMQEFVFPLTGASGWDSGYDVTGFRFDPLQYENSSFTIRTIIIELTDGSRRVFNFTEPDAYKSLVSTANLLNTVTYSDAGDSYVPVTNAGNLPVSAYLGQSVSAKAPGAVTETTSGHYEFRDLPGGTYMVRFESGTTDLSRFEKATNADSVYDDQNHLIAAELKDILLPSTTENYASTDHNVGFYGKSTVVLNYDRKVAVDPVSFRAEAPSIALAEACDATNWSDTLEKTDSKGRTVTFAQVTDGKVVITPYDLIYSKDQPSASLFYRLSYADGTSIIREISIKPADIIYYEESNDNLMTFTDGQRGSWIKVTGQYDHNAAGDAADYDQNADNQYQDADTGTDDYDSQYSGNGDNLYFSAGTARMVNVTADVRDASKTSPFPSLQFSFYGTGFDLVSMGTPYGGVVNVQVYAGKLEDGKKPIYTEAVNTRYGIYYGDHDGGSETRPSEGREVDRLYQGTALLKDDLEYGMYTVVCTPMYSSYFDPYDVGSFDILVDGVRILNPLGETPEYQRTAFNEILTSSVSLFITEYGKTELCDKLEHGPKYEIHLAPQQSIAVSVTAKAGATLRVGAQSFSGKASKLSVYSVSDFKSDASTSPIYEQALNVATEMHYPVRTWAKDETQILLFKNTGEAPIALTSFEYVAGKVTELKCDPDDTQAALDLANALLLPEDPSKDTGSLAISAATLLLSSDIGINFYVPEENLKGVTDPYMVITKEIYDWRGNVSRIEEKKLTAYTVKDGRRVYTFDGISASEMGSLVTATMHGTDSTGKDVSGPSVPYSVKTYAMNQLASTTDEKLKTLLVDMLNYGAAAQEYWGYHTQQPVNGDLTADQQSCATQEDPTLEDSTQVSNSGSILFSSVSLVLKDRVAIKYYLRPDGYTGKISDLTLKISYTDKNGATQTDSITGDKFTTYTKDGKTYYAVVFDSLNPAQMRSVCTAQVFDKDGNQVSGQLTYSIESYAARTLQSSGDEKLNTLVNNMMKYGDSTAKYFGVSTKQVRKARQAYEICYSYSLDQAKNLEGVTSGWQVDNRAGLGEVTNTNNGVISDVKTDEHSRLLRYFNNETAGRFDLRYALNYTGGFDGNIVRLSAEDGSDTYYLETKGDGFYIKGKDGNVTTKIADKSVIGENSSVQLRVIVDLDRGVSRTILNGVDCGTHPLLGSSFRLLSFETTDEDTCTTVVKGGYAEANYAIFEEFTFPTRAIPSDFTNDGALSLEGEYLRLAAGKKTACSFEPLSNKVCFTFSTKPEKNDQNTSWSLCAGDDAVVKLELRKGYLYANGQKIMKTMKQGVLTDTQEQLQNNMWHLIRVEADVATQKAVIKVHTKQVATVDFLTRTSYVDSVLFDNTASAGYVELDDIMVYNLVDYDVPAPDVVNDNYNIGINVCSLWANGGHWGWATITPHDDLKPVLGYYDENLTETADWEIKYMTEHGIDFQAFCWFASSGNGALTPSAKHLNRAFVNAKYSDKMKFCLLWEAANGSFPTSVDAFKNYYVPYIIENYFTNPSYMTIDNKPVIAIFGASKIREYYKNDAKTVRDMFDYLRAEARKVGFDGVIVLDCNSGETKLKDYGFDGWYAYNWGTDYTLERDKANNLNRQKRTDAYTVPTISVGFNHVGWAQERFPMMSVSDFKAANEWVRNYYLPTYANKSESEEDDWQENFAMISTWNEYGEGTYIMPSDGLHGFEYLDALREVYSGGGTHTDVKPTAEQKALITHNYPQDIRLLRRNGEDTGMQPLSVKTYTTNFYNVNMAYNMTVLGNGVFHATTDGPYFILNDGDFKGKDASELLRLRVKASGIPKGQIMQLYYATDKNGRSEANSIKLKSTTDEEQEFVFALCSRPSWTGKMTSLMLKPVDKNDVTFTIESVTLEYGGNYPTVFINGTKLNNQIQTETQNGVAYVPFEPGVSMINHALSLYFDWSYETKTLTLYRNKHSYQFVVGKDYALVDGNTQVSLGGSVYQRDNIPMLPIEGLAKTLGLHYTKSGIDYRISTQEASYFDSEADGIWTFNRSGDTRGWTMGGGTMSFTNDALVIEGTKTSQNTYDPRLSRENLNLDCSKYTQIEVCVKWDITGSKNSDVMKIYYATTAASGLSESKTARIDIDKSSNGEFKILTFNMAKTGSWNGFVTQLRFDPFDDAGTTEVKYIRFVEAKEKTVLVEDDAEGTAKFFVGDNQSISIVTDPTAVNNKCYYVTSSYPTWLYAKTNATFTPGTTYQIDFDVMLAPNSPVDSTDLFCNLQYMDEHGKTDHNEHHVTIKKNGGWVHFSAQQTVSANSTDRSKDLFTVYSNPYKPGDKAVSSCFYYLDNVKVTVVDGASAQSAVSNFSASTPANGTGAVYSAALPLSNLVAELCRKSFQDK